MKATTEHILTVLRSGSLARVGLLVVATSLMSQCAGKVAKTAPATNMVVSVQQQKIALYSSKGTIAKTYPVSTSKFGLGDKPGTNSTPLGMHEVVAKIGHGARSGTVFKARQPTGEIIKPNVPGRDPIVSRIMWLRGMEAQNKNAYRRCIYIHGTADEQNVGRPVSYGCVRMRSADVMELFNKVGIGSKVLIVQGKLPTNVEIPTSPTQLPAVRPSTQPPIFLSPEPTVRPQPNKPVPQPQQRREEQPPAPEPKKFEQPMILAQNSTTLPSEAPSGFQSQSMPNGAVIYTAQGSSSSRIVLKSRRHAQDGLSKQPQ